MRAKRATAASGRMPIGVGGQGIVGYEYDPITKTRSINELKTAVIRMVYERCASGKSAHDIAKELNARDICTTRGGFWPARTVENILRHPSCIGWDVYGKYRCWIIYLNRGTRDEKKNIERTLRPEGQWIWIEGFSLAIVDPQLWDTVQERLDMPRAKVQAADNAVDRASPAV